MTPDIPLLLGWSIVIYALVTAHPRWAWFGLSIGLLSKPTAVLMIPAVISRFGWARSFAILTAALAVCIPMLEWSSSHEWLPFSFQGARSFSIQWQSLIYILEAIGVQLLLVGPLLCWTLWHLVFKSRDTHSILIRWMCLPILTASLAVCCGMHLEANWPMMLWAPIVVFAPILAAQSVPSIIRWQRLHSLIALVLLIALPVILHQLPGTLGPDRDGPQLERCLRAQFPSARILAVRYQEMALLSEAAAPAYLLVVPSKRRSQYNLWKDRLVTQVSRGDVVLNLAGQCPSKERAYTSCAVPAFECLLPHR